MNINEIRNSFIHYFENESFKHLMHSPVVSEESDNTLFTVAGMKQFSDFFRNPNIATHEKIVTVQPCLRISGKHDDLNNIGKTTRHQTLFEMLGIFSFGKLTKKNTIHLLWNWFTQILKIDKQYLYVTIYKTDDEAYEIWSTLIDKNRIARAEMDTNFWSAGSVGLCGPCSEIFFDKEKTAINEPYQNVYLQDRFLEICNMVFMSYDRQHENELEHEMKKLPCVCIDVGAGLERVASVVNETYDNYSVSTIAIILKTIQKYHLNLIENRIMADHFRSILFIVSEGIRPGIKNQSHVLRRLIRRVLLFWCTYVNNEPIIIVQKETLNDILNSVVNALNYYMHNMDIKIIDECVNIILNEANILNNIIEKSHEMILQFKDNINEHLIVNLYTTYGMPIDVSMFICTKMNSNLILDEQIIDNLIKQHANKQSFTLASQQITIKECYEKTHSMSNIVELFNENRERVNQLNANQIGFIITKNTPFYAQGGGQAGDIGEIYKNNILYANVTNTIYQKIAKEMYTVIHIVQTLQDIHINDIVELKVNEYVRMQRTRAHSATHLLHDFLITKYKIKQAGSRVTEDAFTFDVECHERKNFNDMHVEIEQFINEVIAKKANVIVEIVNQKEVQNLIYGENKYDDNVRVVTMKHNDTIYSRQLCGGTHVSNTEYIRNFKIIRESALSRNVRRFTCVTNFDNIQTTKQQVISNFKYNVTLQNIYTIIECFDATNDDLQNTFNKYYKQTKNVIVYIRRELGFNMILHIENFKIIELIHTQFNCFGILSPNKTKYTFGSKLNINNTSIIDVLKVI